MGRRARRPRPLPRCHRGTLPAPGQRRVLAGGHLPPRPGAGHVPRRRPRRDDAPLRRADARGGAGAHVAGGTAGAGAAGVSRSRAGPAARPEAR
ncbi:Exonuclease SbcC [Streptomyces misionensis JCM 4497]